MAEERSRDRSSSAESQPKFPGCSHFRCRNDNHLRCQQFRLNEGRSLCTQDSPCLVCKDWLPEAWAAQAKANAQRNRRKAAAATKAAKKAEETMDDSVEIHAPEEAIQLPSKCSKSEGSSKTKRTKTKATTSESSQPKSVASSVSVVGRPSSHGSDRRRSRSPERKRRHRDDKRQDSPRHQAWRLPARERAVPAKFLWRFQLPEACRVWQCLQGVGHPSVGLFLSTSSSFFGRSSIPFINFISGVSRPQVFAQSWEKTRECRPDGSDVHHQTGYQAVPQEFQAAWEENDHGGLFASPAGSCWIGPVPAPVAGRCRPGSRQRLGHRWRPGNTQRHSRRQRHGHRWRFRYRWRPVTGDGPPTVDDPASEDPADVSEVESELQFDEPDETDGPARLPTEARLGTPAATSPGDGPDISRSTGTSSLLFPSIPRCINQETLVDFMSMWTLLQRRMDQSSVPVAPACPPDQSAAPAPRHDSTNRRSATPARTPERIPESPERFLHTPQSTVSSFLRRAREPERKVKTPVRQARMPVRHRSESRESRSRSPLSRSSSVESPARDESPLNFAAAMDPESKRHFSWRGRRRWQQEDLGSSIQDLQTGCVHV